MPDVQKQPSAKIALLGGDLRQLAAKEALEGLGYSVAPYGFATYGDPDSLSLEEALTGASVLLLPVPVLRNDRLNLPFGEEKLPLPVLLDRLTPYLSSIKAVFGGVLPPELTEALAPRGISLFDFCQEERFNILNAVPTAEGAIAIAMNHLDVTVCGAHMGILGFGRIGKALCRLLHALGARVTVAARKDSDRALAELYGYHACDYDALPEEVGEWDVLFNTVPHTVVTEPVLAALGPKTVVIDLASKPGGVDCDAALRHSVTVIAALSLPGKVAPVTAGRILADCLHRRLKEVMV